MRLRRHDTGLNNVQCARCRTWRRVDSFQRGKGQRSPAFGAEMHGPRLVDENGNKGTDPQCPRAEIPSSKLGPRSKRLFNLQGELGNLEKQGSAWLMPGGVYILSIGTQCPLSHVHAGCPADTETPTCFDSSIIQWNGGPSSLH